MKLKNPNKVDNIKKKSKIEFSVGYGNVRSRVEKGSRYTMSCYNCEYYYQGNGDREEVCQNPDVLQYDMVVTESSIYCNRWELCRRTQSVKSIFKKEKRRK